MQIDPPPALTLGIARIGLNVADLAAATAFYRDALGFSLGQVQDGRALLRLGGQEIELTAPDPPGRPYPQLRAANDPWFQHFAIAVSDMPAAYALLSRHAHEPISRGGPQRLPPSTGCVTAYKFRDPDGHPLELSHIPDSAWDQVKPEGGASPSLGVDHSAFAVRDLDASLDFYAGMLGFSVIGRFLNSGPEQDRLDGLDDVQLDIVALQTAKAGPHIELLHYRSPSPSLAPIDLGARDIAATRLLLRVGDLDAVRDRLASTEADTGSAGAPGRTLVARDPDGRLLHMVE